MYSGCLCGHEWCTACTHVSIEEGQIDLNIEKYIAKDEKA
jgi:hypothetical protein